MASRKHTRVVPVASKGTKQGGSEPDDFSVSFPAMRGVQAGRPFFVIMCPLRYLPKLFLFNEEDVPPQLRAQRALNKGRMPRLVDYILENRNDYVFSALTASIDGPMRFDEYESGGHGNRLGVLHIGMEARFLINDGQHRRFAIEEAMHSDPSLADENIPIVIFGDEGLERAQQMFADLNRHAVRPAKSIGILYDHRDDDSGVAKLVVINSDFFRSIVEMERSTLATRSRKLFTLSALYGATQSLLAGQQWDSIEDAADVARSYWEALALQIPEWQAVRNGSLTAGEVRADFIHSHGIALAAFGKVGNSLMQLSADEKVWLSYLEKIKSIDWSRSNSRNWEGRALIGGRVSKATNNVTLTTNLVREHLGLEISAEDQKVEMAFLEGKTA